MDIDSLSTDSPASAVASLHDVELNIDDKAVLKNISLEINSGELLAIIGPNGAGKSSLLRILTGELTAQGGCINFQNKNLYAWSLEERAQSLACLPQQSELNFPYTVEEVVSLSRSPHNTGLQEDRRIIAAAIHALELDKQTKQFYTQLSGGEQQRTQLARVLAQAWPLESHYKGQPLLLLDEPCRGLDPGHERQLIDLLKSFCRKRASVVMVVHDINFASRYADRILALKDGAIFAQGTVEELIRAPLLNDLFDTQASVFKHPDFGYPVYM